MYAITNRKIAAIGPPPRWANFHGFSALFDNPGASYAADTSGRQRLALRPQTLHSGFYYHLFKGLHRLPISELAQQHGFCQLDPASWHVTVWNGIDIKNIDALPAEHRSVFSRVIAGMPATLSDPLLQPILHSELFQWTDWKINFRVARLANWRYKVLAAELEPADSLSATNLELLKVKRKALIDRFQLDYQLLTSRTNFQPHITLGYFANPDTGTTAADKVETSRNAFMEEVEAQILTFSSLSLYGFQDMISFFR